VNRDKASNHSEVTDADHSIKAKALMVAIDPRGQQEQEPSSQPVINVGGRATCSVLVQMLLIALLATSAIKQGTLEDTTQTSQCSSEGVKPGHWEDRPHYDWRN